MTGAWLDSTLPEGLADYLRRQPGSIEADPVLTVLRDVVADARFAQYAREQRPEPEGLRQEAQQLAADILSVRDRLLHLNPYLQAHADKHLWRTWSTNTRNTVKGVEGDLMELARALSAPVPNAKRGRKPRSHDDALATLAAAIENNSKPEDESKKIKTMAARDLAADLLRQCGIDAPKSARQHLRKAKQNTDRT